MKRLLLLLFFLPFAQAQYRDVPAGHWAEEAVLNLTELGVITGFPDGTFGGNLPVSRYQMALIITRVWNNWSADQLTDVWQEIIAQQTGLSRLQAEQQLLSDALAEVTDKLERTEQALLDAASREELDRNSEDVARLSVEVEGLRAQVVTLTDLLDERLGPLQETLNATTEQGQLTTSDVAAQDARLQTLEETLAALQDTLAALQSKAAATPDAPDPDQQRQLDALNDAVSVLAEGLGGVIQEDAVSWRATLGVEVGLEGRDAKAAVLAEVVGANARIDAYVGSDLVDLGVQGELRGGFGVRGYFFRSPDGDVSAFVGPGYRLSPALQFGLLGGTDGRLALGGFVEHRSNQDDSVLPGLDAFVGAILAEDEANALTRLSVQGSAQYRLALGDFYLLPKTSYQRVMGTNPYQAVVPELGVGYEGQGVQVVGALRYGFVTDLLGGPGRNLPEAELTLITGSGFFVSAELTGNLPNRYGFGNFAERNPLLTTDLYASFSIGYSTTLSW